MTKTYTSTQIMEELNLKYSTFYYVLKNGCNGTKKNEESTKSMKNFH